MRKHNRYCLIVTVSVSYFLFLGGTTYIGILSIYHKYSWDTHSIRKLAARHSRARNLSLAPFLVLMSVSPLDHSVGSANYRISPSSSPSLAIPSPVTPSSEFSLESEASTVNDTSLPPRKHDSSKTSAGVNVALSAGGMYVIALLVSCCKSCFGNKCAGKRVKDERPLLNFKTSNFSGSSNDSSGIDGARKKVKIGTLCVNTESNINSHIIDIDSSGATTSFRKPSGNASSSKDLSNASSNSGQIKMSSYRTLKLPPKKKIDSAAPTTPTTPPPPPPLPHRKPKPSHPSPAPPNSIPPPPKFVPPPPKAAPHPPPPRPFPSADAHAPKTKLKPLFWDKVSTNTENSMVWNDIKCGSFQFNEEMIETLFGYQTDSRGRTENKVASSLNDAPQFIQLLEPKKSQNLAISLKAMGVKVDEVKGALMEGNELPAELLQTLLRMAPTSDEELKIRLYTGDMSQLGPGEQFLKGIVEVPFVFKRVDALLFMASLQEDVSSIRGSFACLEVASKELRNSRLFFKLLEAVLKLGNRMNDGTLRGGAEAFKLDTLLKLSDVKGIDGKTTLLHFVLQEIIRSEGARAVRLAKERRKNSTPNDSSLPSNDETDDLVEESEEHHRSLGLKIVSGLSTELENVKKAAGLDADALTAGVTSLHHELVKTKDFLNRDMKSIDEESSFHEKLKSFVEHAEADIALLREEEDNVKSLVKNTTDYFHGKSGRDEGLKLFVIVKDFLGMLDKACKEVRESQNIVPKTQSKESPSSQQSHSRAPSPSPELKQRLFPAIRDRRVYSSSSDDDDS